MRRNARFAVVLVLAVVTIGTLAAVGAAQSGSTDAAAANETNGTVDVSVGAQLSTVIATSTTEVRTEVEDAGFSYEFETSDREEAVAERAAELRERAREIREEYRETTEEFQAGDISRETYAGRLATMNDRSQQLQASVDRLAARAAALDNATRDRTGANETAIDRIEDDLDAVEGAGPRALLARFTGRTSGELEIHVDGGVRIEAEGEDGERSREIRRPGDASLNITVSQDAALATARGALSDAGNWTLVEASVHEEDGQHRFEFELDATGDGEAEVRVDGSSGEVVRVEAEIEPGDADDDDADEREDDADEDDTTESERETEDEDVETEDEGVETEHEDGETEMETETEAESDGPATIDVAVVEGTPEPGATITVAVTSDGEPVSGAAVALQGDVVGTTGADGRHQVTLPDAEDVRIRAETDDADADVEFEFEDDDGA